jgi:hypothetical protein
LIIVLLGENLMSSMLEQAIVDAAALREAALKNAEQSIIDKYAPEIKAAVDSLLENDQRNFQKGDVVRYEGRFARVTTESDNNKVGITMVGENKTHLVMESDLEESNESDLLQEEEANMSLGATESTTPSPYQAPPAYADLSPDQPVDLNMSLEFDPSVFGIDLKELTDSETPQEMMGDDLGGTAEEDLLGGDEDLLGGLGDLGGGEEPAEAPEDETLQEIMNILSEIEDEQVLEEELVVDMAGQHKNGTFETSQAALGYQQEMELARMEADDHKEDNELLEKRLEELDESLKRSQNQTNEFKNIINKMEEVLSETLLSNAKLLYSNQTLRDASLNERQKRKIVEAIATANTPDEAKILQETLRATVGSTRKSGPKSLSESVQRRSNLSGILPRKKQPAQELTFADRMKKLAGID